VTSARLQSYLVRKHFPKEKNKSVAVPFFLLPLQTRPSKACRADLELYVAGRKGDIVEERRDLSW
jgi:hypothetical protein